MGNGRNYTEVAIYHQPLFHPKEMTSPPLCAVHECGEDPRGAVICSFHRKHLRSLSKYRQKELWKLWHTLVCEKSFNPNLEKYQCFHCKLWFDREEVCGDHWPASKASRPCERFNVEAGVCCCKNCNRSDNPLRNHESPLRDSPQIL